MRIRKTDLVRPTSLDRTPKLASALHGKLHLENLEARNLLSVTPFGGEIRVNSFTPGEQTIPAVAADAAGDHVVVWTSNGQDGSGYGVYAQRYNPAGAAQGAEFRVNTFTTGAQSDPAVAMDSAGDFVVAWRSYQQDGSDYGIFAQRFNALGVQQGSEFRVNTFTIGAQDTPAVAMDATGDFVVAWASKNQDGSDYGVYAQRYNAAGVAQGVEFLVNTFTAGVQDNPSVAMDSTGDFVVAWESGPGFGNPAPGQDGNGYGIYAQRYNANGTTPGGEFRVNTYTTNNQDAPAIAMDPNGDFVIGWESFGQDGDGYGIFAQRFNASATPQGSEFQVNIFATGPQSYPAVAMDSTGDFVVAWQSYGQDGSDDGIFAQTYHASGAAQGSPFQVNAFTTDIQDNAAVAMDAGGDFVVAWESRLQDGSSYGIYAQKYRANQPPVVEPSGSIATYTASWAGPAVHITAPTATVTDPDDTNLVSLTISLASPDAGEFLNATASGTVSVLGNGTSTLIFTGGSSLGDYQQTLRNTIFGSTLGACSETVNYTAVDPFGAVGTAVSQILVSGVDFVSNRFIFYQGSLRYDQPGGTNGQTPLAFSDDNAIATDKSAYLPNGTAATYANLSNYDQGITGIMVDLLGCGTHPAITASDFAIKVGNNNSPSLWAAGPTPTVSVRLGMTGAANGAGTVSGSDRVELIWAPHAIQQQWVEVTVKADANTGLAADDVFFFGSEIGNTGSSDTATKATTTNLDVSDAVNHGATVKQNIPITNLYDFSRDGNVNNTDVSDAVNHGTTTKTGLNFINIGPGGPFAPVSGGAAPAGGGVASALASTSTNSTTTPTIPAWIVNRLEHLDLNHGPIAKYLEHLAHENTAKSKSMLVATDQIADALGLDDTLLDSLLVKLGLES